MKIKYVISAVFLLLTAQLLDARNPERKVELTGGLEWGYTATFYQNHNYIFYDEEGMRVDMVGGAFDYVSNGHVLGRLGLRFFNRADLTFNFGYCGIQDARRILTYSLRAGYYYKGYRNNGVFNFLEGGVGGASTFESQPIVFGKLGVGYRIKLNDDLSLDAIISYQLSEDHPKNIEDRNHEIIAYYHQLQRSDIFNSALNFSIAINF